MHTKFGYLNQGNALNIGENEAQNCVNCGLERGWVEYKEYSANNEEPNISADVGTRHFEINNGSIKDNGGKLNTKLEDYFHTPFPSFKAWQAIFETDSMNNFYSGNPILNGVEQASHIEFNSFKYQENVFVYKIPSAARKKYMYYQVPEMDPVTGKPRLPLNSYWMDSNGTCFFYHESNGVPIVEPYNRNDLDRSFVSVDSKFVNNNILSYFLDILYINGDNANVRTSIDDRFFSCSYNVDGSFTVSISSDAPMPKNIIETFLGFHFAFQSEWGYNENSFVIKPHTPPRDIFYAATVKETINGIEKETKPFLFQKRTQDVPFLSCMKIEPPPQSELRREDMEYSIYRIPEGGNEYLFDFNIPVKDGNLYDRKVLDKNNDESLGALLTTADLTDTLIISENVSSIVIHKDMLFASIGNVLWFSKQGILDQFPAKNFFVFQDKITGLVPYNSNLMVLTEKEAYVVYGSNEEGFLVNKLNFDNTTNLNHTGRSAYDRVITLNNTGYNLAVSELNSRYGYDIGSRVRAFLNEQSFGEHTKNHIQENRFYVAALSRANLVYDVLNRGFLISENLLEPTHPYLGEECFFRYRTKEYLGNGQATSQTQSNKALVVRAKGKIKVKAYGDMKCILEKIIDFGEIVNTKSDILMLRKRYNTFSVEFLGLERESQVHGWDICNA